MRLVKFPGFCIGHSLASRPQLLTEECASEGVSYFKNDRSIKSIKMLSVREGAHIVACRVCRRMRGRACARSTTTIPTATVSRMQARTTTRPLTQPHATYTRPHTYRRGWDADGATQGSDSGNEAVHCRPSYEGHGGCCRWVGSL